jgi:hypothetical protein
MSKFIMKVASKLPKSLLGVDDFDSESIESEKYIIPDHILKGQYTAFTEHAF